MEKNMAVTKLWVYSFGISLGLYIFSTLYLAVERGEWSLQIINSALAYTALFLVGISMGLGSVCYFWNFLDAFLNYRKYLGIYGFIIATFHSVVTLFLLNNVFPFGGYFSSFPRVLSFTFGAISLLILLIMTLVSNTWAMKMLGPKEWKFILRLGYFAYIFGTFHMVWHNIKDMSKWLNNLYYLPPLSFVAFCFLLLVIGLRLTLEWSLSQKKSLRN